MLYHLWVYDTYVFTHERLRAQSALLLIIAGATSTRPDALLKVCWKHVEFQLFPPQAKGGQSRLGLVWDLVELKNSRLTGEETRFGFHEEAALLHDALLLTLALALADNAFFNDFTDAGQLYTFTVPSNSDRLRFLWKDEWKDRYIFRDIIGLEVAMNIGLKYTKARMGLIRLGREIGIAKRLEWYDLRRGSGKKLNGKV